MLISHRHAALTARCPADTLGTGLGMLRVLSGILPGRQRRAGFVLSASWSDPMLAIGLGPVTQQSALGQSATHRRSGNRVPGEEIAPNVFGSARPIAKWMRSQLRVGRTSSSATSAGAQLVIHQCSPVKTPCCG